MGLSLSALLSSCSGEVHIGIGATGLNEVGYKIKQLAFSWPSAAGVDTYKLLENPDGISGYNQIASDFPATTTSYDHDIAVHLHDWANASYILQSCIGIDCTDSTARFATNSSAAIGYFKASNADIADNFGHSVTISDDGNTVAVGAWAEDGEPVDNLPDSGAVYVFTRVAGVWQGPVYIKASNADSNDQFGYSVALSSNGSTLAVGARQEAGNGVSPLDNTAAGAGAVYVFVRDGSGNWSEEAYIKASNAEAGDNLGQAVALSDDGNTLAVGAPGEDSATNIVTDSGAVYTFKRSAGIWTQQAYLKASNAADLDGFGNAVSISSGGSVLAVAASLADDLPANTDNGAVYLFTYGTVWSETAMLRASNPGTNDKFGTSLALYDDGTTLVVGAPFEDSDGMGVNDNTVNSGAAYVFINSGGWIEQAMIKPAVVEANDQFGFSVGIGGVGGDILAVGADLEDGDSVGLGGDSQVNTAIDSGAGYIFTRDAGVWTQHTYLKSSNTEFNDRFGAAMAMSADGQTLVVGAINEDGAATGIGGDQASNTIPDAGAVYLY